MIRLETNLPEFFNELCEVVRLFYGMVDIRDVYKRQALHRGPKEQRQLDGRAL